jgi:AcrR family transcriptional regulator
MRSVKKAQRKNRSREPLSRDRIERAALALIERDGLAAFSTRRLGEVLGCEAMSIYHHFPSKAHILDALVDRVVREAEIPPATLPPFERLCRGAHSYRALGLKYPHFFQFFALHRLDSAAGLMYLERVLEICRDCGLKPEQAARFFRVIGYYLIGAVLDETSGYAEGPASLDPVPEEAMAARFPLIAAAGDYFTPEHFEKTFEFGLKLLLDGVASMAGAPRIARARQAGARRTARANSATHHAQRRRRVDGP